MRKSAPIVPSVAFRDPSGRRSADACETQECAAVGYILNELESSISASGLSALMLVAWFVVWVILDLNQPQQGTIRVSQESMRRVLDAMQ